MDAGSEERGLSGSALRERSGQTAGESLRDQEGTFTVQNTTVTITNTTTVTAKSTTTTTVTTTSIIDTTAVTAVTVRNTPEVLVLMQLFLSPQQVKVL